MKMPPIFQEVQQGRLVLKQGGGCLSVFGLPFFAAGVFVLLLSIGVVPMRIEGEANVWARFFIFILGFVFSTIGAGLVFGRSWTTFDRHAGTIVETMGLLIPMREKTLYQRDYKNVSLRFDKGDSDTSDTFPILLERQDGQKPYKIVSPIKFGEAHDIAVFLADFLALPFVDQTTPNAHMVSLKQEAEVSSPPPPPARLVSTISEPNGVLEIFIPEPNLWLLKAVFTIFVLAMVWASLPSMKNIRSFDLSRSDDVIGLAFYGVFFLLILAPMLRLTKTLPKRQQIGTLVTVTNGQISIIQAIPLTKKTSANKSTYKGDEILSIGWQNESGRDDRKEPSTTNTNDPFAPPSLMETTKSKARSHIALMSNVLVLKTNQEIIRFGAGLPAKETAYLASLIEKKLFAK